MAQKISYLFHHIFFPPRLPRKDDSSNENDLFLLEECENALRAFSAHVPDGHAQVRICASMLRNMIEVRESSGQMSSRKIAVSLREMEISDILAFHIRGQNAGLIVRRLSNYFSFESFELSPTSEAVTGTKGRLIRFFPGPAIAVPNSKILDTKFTTALGQLLAQLDVTTPKEAWPVVTKAKSQTEEIRDSINPRFVTEMLTGILRGVGEIVNVNRIHKCTRDEVSWSDSFLPWRRSPLWLLIRVALQTSIMGSETQAHERYKSFMVFFLGRLLEQATLQQLSSELLFIMSAKISRRATKLADDKIIGFQYVQGVIDAAQHVLRDRWHKIENDPDPNKLMQAGKLDDLCFSDDTRLTCLTLKPYLENIRRRIDVVHDGSRFMPQCSPRLAHDSQKLPAVDDLTGDEDAIRLALKDVELWVRENLGSWLMANSHNHNVCTVLGALLEKYASVAIAKYAGNPEDHSLALLTVMDLWVALDKCVTSRVSLLKCYKTGFSISLFDPMLLPSKLLMQRLSLIEEYIRRRDKTAPFESTLIFREANLRDSFAIQYFARSIIHQDLKQEIESAAKVERAKKLQELENKQQEYHSLMERSASLTCQNVELWNSYYEEYYSTHDPSCEKCRLEAQAISLEIEVHEWPLPYKELEAQSAIFELAVPSAMSTWRDLTYSILVDFFSPPITFSQSNSPKTYSLHTYTGLINYVRTPPVRLQMLSESKSFVQAHYRTKKVPQADKDNICVNNGLHYSIYDSKWQRPTKELLNRCNIRSVCTLRLPPGVYESLQFALDEPIHTSNDVLARQSECPKGLDLHEFYAFTTMRSGHRLQWRGLARELAIPSLNFRRDETYLLLAQVAWEAGPPRGSDVCRDSHHDLEEESFGRALILLLEKALDKVQGNWQEAAALRVYVILATRLLSINPYDDIHQGCYEFLNRARCVAISWTREICGLLHDEEDESQRRLLSERALEMALTCHGTFNVDPHHIDTMFKIPSDVSMLVESYIIINNHSPAMIQELSTSLQLLYRRFERLAHSIESQLQEAILEDHSILNLTLTRMWEAYRPKSEWNALAPPNARWLRTITSGPGAQRSIEVHYNLLNGTLLVDGKPLARLPKAYELHATYQRLFGKKILEVGPSTMNGMIFETRRKICGQQIHFRMLESELLIRSEDARTCELIPTHALHSDFPNALVQDYTHWLDLHTNRIEWRPLTSMWSSTQANWWFSTTASGEMKLQRGVHDLLDVRSATVRAITKILSPLEDETHIQVIQVRDAGPLAVQLPRMKLDFHIDNPKSTLESKQFRGMIVDHKQCFGAFTGLKNKLILREKSGTARSVIVPHGKVTYAKHDHHVRVTVNTGSAKFVKYHIYQIDCRLGRLTDNSNLESRLFRLYLHATTSHCLIDQLTRRTGTEEALSGLAEAASRSFVRLRAGDQLLLEELAQLTPTREFYPRHLEVMQQVHWSSLPTLAQHGAFQQQVDEILSLARSFSIFHEQNEQIKPSSIRTSKFLSERASIRDASFRVHEFGAESFTTCHDKQYKARDTLASGDRETNTYVIASLVEHWSTYLKVCPQLLGRIESWGGPLRGPQHNVTLTKGFSLEWLRDLKEIMPVYWFALHDFLSNSDVNEHKYEVMILLATLSYSAFAQQDLIQTLLAFATVPSLRQLQSLIEQDLQLADEYDPSRATLVELTRRHSRPYYKCPERNMEKLFGETNRVAEERRKTVYRYNQIAQADRFVDHLLCQWPTANVVAPSDSSHSIYIEIDDAMVAIIPRFESWFRNEMFRRYIGDVQRALDSISTTSNTPQRYTYLLPVGNHITRTRHLTFASLASGPAPQMRKVDDTFLNRWIVPIPKRDTGVSRVEKLVEIARSRAATKHELRYSTDIQKSCEALQEDIEKGLCLPADTAAKLQSHLKDAIEIAGDNYKMMCDHLRAQSRPLSHKTQMLPRLSPIIMLSHLTQDKLKKLPTGWQLAFVRYGLSLTALQRAERLVAAISNHAELLNEIKNPGHSDWDPVQHPEWLLFEAENGILIRREQAQIAREMMSPPSSSNSVMQLNMGQGKSSVIVPIIAATLGNREQLVRVIVLRSLAMQMFQLLVKVLGKALNRRIYYMPISRSLKMSSHQAREIDRLFKECMDVRGVLLVQPEHLLSFELMGPERLISNDPQIGEVMTKTQDWLYANSRDILDESDEILSVRFELIYTIGLQRAIEFGPDRWVLIQDVLDLISLPAEQLQKDFPQGLEVLKAQAGGFDRLRILEPSVGDELCRLVVQRICEVGLPGLPLWNLSPVTKTHLSKYLLDPDYDLEQDPTLFRQASESESMQNGLLILRGLFAFGILKFAFSQKRWRVNYGLDSTRSLLAVPYNAKDTPTARAEFSHPDATIVFTCLAYYYGGLDDAQILQTFEALSQTDRAEQEYNRWVQDAQEMPTKYKHLSSINMSNIGQCSLEVFPPLRFAKAMINFYLSSVVFPAEMKEFTSKLSSSGWDIAREKSHCTTGFSGTNDSRYVLPLSISQCDLPSSQSTNAAVLDCLLRPENCYLDVSGYSATGSLTAEILLETVVMSCPPIRVILDVGAQVLELRNEELAHQWLSRVPESEAEAVVFFDTQNELCVLSRDGTKEPLQISPFAKHMDRCLVYLDESHTRGVDLRLPTDYRAIVTLGPNLTKDRLTQACMRMRKLGKGQSILFCASKEIHKRILESSNRSYGIVQVLDVLAWSMEQTCTSIRKDIPLWATQGIRHQRQRNASQEMPMTRERVEILLEPEAQGLQTRYGSRRTQQDRLTLDFDDQEFSSRRRELADIRAKCEEFNVVSFDTATLQEEQERELSPENERQQEVELPPTQSPTKHTLHDHVRTLVLTGTFLQPSDAFLPAFTIFARTTASKHFESYAWSSDLFVTADFATTVKTDFPQQLDSFLRPVHWILSCKTIDTTKFVILSPYEAHHLLPDIRGRKHVTLHVYSPRTSQATCSLEKLSFCAVPAVPVSWSIPLAVMQINLFAGQLYLRTYAEYESLCEFLGMCSRSPGEGADVAIDGFIKPSKSGIVRVSRFTTSPVSFINAILALRRKGKTYTFSHMGRVVNRGLLSREEFLHEREPDAMQM